jgi:gamma-glutamyltranspeptidase/glutathione hydrolase
MKKVFISLFILAWVWQGCREASPTPFTQKGVIADKAMVVSAHPLATEIGLDILRKGGNAIDAMVAVHTALAVTTPRAGNIGGGGFMVMRTKDGQTHCLDFREMAPSKGGKNMYLDRTGNPIDSLSTFGHLAAGVPGAVAGMVAAHDSLGTLPWATLIQPAIDLARKGVTFSANELDNINKKTDAIRRYSTQTNAFIAHKEWTTKDTLFQPELAASLERIRDEKRKGFYEGETARLILEEMQRGGGLISQLDLINYQVVWREALRGNYRDYGIIGMPPPSSGGIALIQLLEMVESYPLGSLGWQSGEAVHLMIEAERRVYADRAKHMGDMDYYPVPISQLLDSTYLAQRMVDFDPNKATSSDAIQAGEIDYLESEETTHFSIVDAEGNAIAVTTTLNGSFGNCVVVGGAGFLLNNEMDDFSLKPGVPNSYGLVGASANAIAPGKRMLSSMSPTIIEKDGKLFMVVGTPGGSKIITTVFQVVTHVIDFEMSMQGAVNAPRFHHQWRPEKVDYEADALTQALASLIARGHILEERKPMGLVNAILRLPNGKLEGAADPRRDGKAAGY